MFYPCVLRWANTLLLKSRPFAGFISLRRGFRSITFASPLDCSEEPHFELNPADRVMHRDS